MITWAIVRTDNTLSCPR